MRRTCTSPRWKGFDYSTDNYYFVTTVIKNRIPCFGQIENGEMKLNEFGKIALKQWLWLADNFQYIRLYEFVIMPDHVHGIIEIIRPPVGAGRDLRLQGDRDLRLQGDRYLRLQGDRDLRQRGNEKSVNKIKPLSEIMAAYKTTVSKKIHLGGLDSFKWQRSFHDRVIRNDNELFWISKYINDNPKNSRS